MAALSDQDLLHHMPMHIRKPETAALGAVGELGVIEAQDYGEGRLRLLNGESRTVRLG